MDVPAGARLSGARSAPPATIAALLATLAAVVAALALHASGDRGDAGRASAFLWLFTALFALRVLGQVVVLLRGPGWLPPMEQWNLLPYPLLLPLQLVLLGAMTSFAAGLSRAHGVRLGYALIGLALVYGAAMIVRYVVRMKRRPAQRWFGGTIPIVFHCVLAAWLFVLGSFHAAG
jgi:hypothetical protein